MPDYNLPLISTDPSNYFEDTFRLFVTVVNFSTNVITPHKLGTEALKKNLIYVSVLHQ